MHFDHIGHLETIQTDLKEILPHLNATEFSEDFPTRKLSLGEVDDNFRYTHMYTSIPDSVLKPLFDKYRADADMFGYDFEHYMSDKYSHWCIASDLEVVTDAFTINYGRSTVLYSWTINNKMLYHLAKMNIELLFTLL